MKVLTVCDNRHQVLQCLILAGHYLVPAELDRSSGSWLEPREVENSQNTLVAHSFGSRHTIPSLTGARHTIPSPTGAHRSQSHDQQDFSSIFFACSHSCSFFAIDSASIHFNKEADSPTAVTCGVLTQWPHLRHRVGDHG